VKARSALVIVPTYNERDNLPLIAAGLMALPGITMLIVDDQSPDGTGDVADALARQYPPRIEVLHRTGSRGLGRSYLDAMERSLHRPFDAICQMDADLSHDPRHLPDMLAALDQAEVVIGSRYVPGGGIVNWPWRRRLLSRCANVYIRLVARLGARDCTSGYRCWRRETLAGLPLGRIESEGYSYLVEMLYLAARKRFRIAERPITFVERRQGESKLSTAVLLESIVTPWRLIAGRAARGTAPAPPAR
jgi:dolichol-phosphate mannosyltransferase